MRNKLNSLSLSTNINLNFLKGVNMKSCNTNNKIIFIMILLLTSVLPCNLHSSIQETNSKQPKYQKEYLNMIYRELIDKIPINKIKEPEKYRDYRTKLIFLKEYNPSALSFLRDIYFGFTGLDVKSETKIKIAEKKDQIKKITEQLKKFSPADYQYSTKLNEKIKSKNKAKDSLKIYKKMISNLNREISNKKKQIENTKKLKNKSKNDSILFVNIKKNFEDSLSLLLTENASLKKNTNIFIQENKNKISILTSKIEKLTSRNSEFIKRIKEVKNNRKRIKELENEITILKKDKYQGKDRFSIADGMKIDHNRSDLNSANKELLKLTDLNRTIKKSFTLQQKRDYLKDKRMMNKLTIELKELTAIIDLKNSSINKIIKKNSDKISHLKSQLTEVKTAIKNNSSLNNYSQKFNQIEKNEKALQNTIAYQQQIQERRKRLKTDIKKINTEIAKIKKTEKDDKIIALKKQLVISQKALTKYYNDLKNLNRYYKLKDALKADIANLDRYIFENNDIKKLIRKNEIPQKDITNLEESIKKKEEEIIKISKEVYIPEEELTIHNDIINFSPNEINLEIYQENFCAFTDFFSSHTKFRMMEIFDILNYLDRNKNIKKDYNINDKHTTKILLDNFEKPMLLKVLSEEYFNSIKMITRFSEGKYDKHIYHTINTLYGKNISFEVYFDNKLEMFKPFIEEENKYFKSFTEFDKYGLYAYWVKVNKNIEDLSRLEWDKSTKTKVIASGRDVLPSKIANLQKNTDNNYKDNLKSYNNFLNLLIYDLAADTKESEKNLFHTQQDIIHTYICDLFQQDLNTILAEIKNINIYSGYKSQKYRQVADHINRFKSDKDDFVYKENTILYEYLNKIYNPAYDYIDDTLLNMMAFLEYENYYTLDNNTSYIAKVDNILKLKKIYNRNFEKNIIAFDLQNIKILDQNEFIDKTNKINKNLGYIKHYIKTNENYRINHLIKKSVEVYKIYNELYSNYKGVPWPYSEYVDKDEFEINQSKNIPQILLAIKKIIEKHPEKKEKAINIIKKVYKQPEEKLYSVLKEFGLYANIDTISSDKI